MVKELDCRKMDCPAPVLETKKSIESEALKAKHCQRSGCWWTMTRPSKTSAGF
jgi:hypothetical protein